MANEFTTEMANISGFGGASIEAYLAKPKSETPIGGVVLIHHMPGWDDQSKQFTARLAFYGYNTICPNLYVREAPGQGAAEAAATVRANGGIADAQAVGDMTGAAEYLRKLPNSNGKVGIIGFCSGGRLAYLSACQAPFDAVVDCHGGNVVQKSDALSENQPVSPVTLTAQMSGPLLGLFGADDQNPSPDMVKEIDAELTKHNKEHEFHSYEGAGHEFMNWARPSYRTEAANEAWEKLLAFFQKNL